MGDISASFGQSVDNNPWCPPDARWIYQGAATPGGGVYYVFEYEKDTTVNNIQVKKIKKKTVNYWYSGPNGEISRSETYSGYELMYNSNDSVFIFVNNAFKFLYDFSPNIGDTLPVDTTWATCSEAGYPVKQNLVVDSIYPYVYDGISFTTIRYYFDNNVQYYYYGPVIKNIGSYNDVFPVPTYLCSGQINADYTSSSTLLCYYDSIRGEINFRQPPQGLNCHMITTNIENQWATENLPFIMYSNPANDLLNIENVAGKSFDYKIIDTNGKFACKKVLTVAKNLVSIEKLPDGLYILLLQSNRHLYTFKFIKQ